MKRKKKFDLSLLISIIALIVSGIVAYFQLIQSSKSIELSYKQQAIENRPEFKLVNYSYELNSLRIGSMNIDFNDDKSISENRIFNPVFILKKTFSFVNVGNSNALYISYLNSDYKTTDPLFIRNAFEKFVKNNSLYSNDTNSLKIDLKNSFKGKSYYYMNDTLNLIIYDTLNTERSLNFLSSYTNQNEFISHIFIIYKNGEGMFYDTYYMIKFKLNNPIVYEPLLTTKPKLEFNKDNINNYFIKDEILCMSSKIYDKKESILLEKFESQIKVLQDKYYKKSSTK